MYQQQKKGSKSKVFLYIIIVLLGVNIILTIGLYLNIFNLYTHINNIFGLNTPGVQSTVSPAK